MNIQVQAIYSVELKVVGTKKRQRAEKVHAFPMYEQDANEEPKLTDALINNAVGVVRKEMKTWTKVFISFQYQTIKDYGNGHVMREQRFIEPMNKAFQIDNIK